MLSSLRIENFAIIEQVQIDFKEGMTVLSGETGAGKSIIIDAIGILCGGRGSIDFIRKGSESCLVEGVFTVEATSPLRSLLQTFGFTTEEFEEGLLVRREIFQTGRNVIRLNQHLANVSMLKQVGRYLVDIHGQNEHQTLLDASHHLELLDQFGGDELLQALEAYQEAFHQFRQIRKDLVSKRLDEHEAAQRLNFLEFQLQELESLALVADEDETLKAQSKKLQGAQLINQALSSINHVLIESDQSVNCQLDQVVASLTDLQAFDPATYGPLTEQLQTLHLELKEVAREVAFSFDLPEYDDQLMDEIQGRLSQLEQAQKKYGRSIEDLITYQNEIAEEIYQLKHQESYQQHLQEELAKTYQFALDKGLILSQSRQRAIGDLVGQIEQQLQDLYMPHSHFEVRRVSVGPDKELEQLLKGEFLHLEEGGLDKIEFYITTNLGEDSQPLARIASGGELSRFMLAVKTIFSQKQAVGTLIFDEIDTGVSGRVASSIANKMVQIARTKQVLCITHLAQVAAAADCQLMISKHIQADRTSTRVSSLSQEQRVEMIAGMLSGEVQSQSSLEVATQLIQSYQGS